METTFRFTIVLVCALLAILAGCSKRDQAVANTPLDQREAQMPNQPTGTPFESKPLYRVRFTYPEEWSINLAGKDSTESQHFFIAEGRTEGRVAGRFRGANHPQRRGDGTYLPDFQGVIATDDGANIFFDWRGYGRAYPPGRRQIVVVGTHLSDHEKYRWLNDVVSVGVGEVRSRPDGPTELVIDWSEVVWKPIGE